jgi:hypothetical protein
VTLDQAPDAQFDRLESALRDHQDTIYAVRNAIEHDGSVLTERTAEVAVEKLVELGWSPSGVWLDPREASRPVHECPLPKPDQADLMRRWKCLQCEAVWRLVYSGFGELEWTQLPARVPDRPRLRDSLKKRW